MTAPTYPVPSGDPETLRTAARQYKTLAQDHSTLLTTFQRHVDAILKGWTGPLAAQYKTAAEGVYPRFKAVHEAAASAHTALHKYAGALETAQKAVSGANRSSSKDAHNSHASAAAHGQSVHQLGLQVSDANSALSRAAGTCASALGQAQTTLARTCPDTMSAKQLKEQVDKAGEELKEENPGLWEKLFGPEGELRKWDEKLHAVPAPYADMVLLKLMSSAEGAEESAKTAEEFAARIPELMEADFPKMARPIMNAMSRGEATEADLAQAIEDFAKDWDAIAKWNAGTKAAGLSEAARLPWLRGVGVGLNGLAFIGDAYTMVNPEDKGAMGWVDRGAAGVNAGLVGWDTLALLTPLDAVPGVGEVVMIGTGLFLGGDYLYHHWKPFKNVCDATGHAVASAAKSTWHAVTSIF
ncbi:WXG100 family type VII secretion target [Streptomyces sp. NBC_00847]|uniref:WXG100 family type VII secretion target n=1 Tax=Streptomyces sp. NBC_01530 TaxID=2903895 RepID=UPI00386AADD8|nr:WXG100 family type VII secretion target [Streptomyces sp. NBC_00847]